MFLPCTREEMARLGWQAPDVILVTGDAYIDSPFLGVAVIGKLLMRHGFRVAIIAQPDFQSGRDITRLGEPTLFWGVTGGSIDSMVANRTASGRPRKTDDYTPGGRNTRRPDRAVIVYANLIRRHFKNTVPLVLGGIEASLRRIAHYDAWENRVRRSILFDAKADYLLYGMAEQSVIELAQVLAAGRSPLSVRGLCYAASAPPPAALQLPAYEEAAADKQAFIRMFHTFYANNDSLTALPLAQRHNNRYLVHNPPQPPLTTAELDAIHALEFERDVHPLDRRKGKVRALDTIRFALTTHRGCYGECHFCAIAVHQGRIVQSRSAASIVQEAKLLTTHPDFKGVISDVGGPTANMYGFECTRKPVLGACHDKRCLYPSTCRSLKVNHQPLIDLMQQLRAIPGVKKVVVASGVRYDMLLADHRHGLSYLREVIRHHISGQMKIAPEHSDPAVLAAMGKSGPQDLLTFRTLFTRLTKEERLDQFLTYYLIAAHPGCTFAAMERLRSFCKQELHLLPRQIQLFTPTPSTWSTLMYWTEINPFTNAPCFVEKSETGRERQKAAIISAAGRPAGSSAPGTRQRKKRKP
ncbi:YgiQ family radical SAM protein [Desulfobulbus oligotrophicus]|uniref:YgiQ family radical SAM protein n=1 Tax=Desulfobulbus oligotrophicus TaxID=1909699 RepID=A0A7T6AQ52_9BACT|nr:YgiQ family radical SAM protein [Desulfobulbus oligotrophicus]QQG65361.1 YgiQ family radical SAM protein [Desulfobulbus oligotrophicus]